MNKQQVNYFLALLLLVQLLFLKWLTRQTEDVEYYYSSFLYPFISTIFRFLLQFISFSVGDLLYAFLGIYIFHSLVKSIRKRSLLKLNTIVKVFAFLSIILLLFNVLWGFNYYRKPLANHLIIEKTSFTSKELQDYVSFLIDDLNKTHFKITKNDTLKVTVPYSKDSIYIKSVESYINLSNTYAFLNTPNLKVKNSLYSVPLTYMGFAGYLNPFTNEAQVNRKIPLVSLITTSCHELGHQVGFGAEYEANMLAYLVSVNNVDKYFQYAGKLMALRYIMNELYIVDKNLYDENFSKLNKGIILNIEESQQFWQQYKNPLEPFFKIFYDIFLKSNAQHEGIKSYKRVVGLIINHHQQLKKNVK